MPPGTIGNRGIKSNRAKHPERTKDKRVAKENERQRSPIRIFGSLRHGAGGTRMCLWFELVEQVTILHEKDCREDESQRETGEQGRKGRTQLSDI